MDWINEDGKKCAPQPTPEQEGRLAAQARIPFEKCPYTYGNSGVASMDEYAATGNNLKRDLWFKGWRAEQTAMGLDSRFLPLETPNVVVQGRVAGLPAERPSGTEGSTP